MTKTQSKDSDSLSLEDLFRLKRAEVPPEGFWQQFEDDLRQKSLKAIVQTSHQQRRSLWQGWGLGTCMASMFSLALPLFIFLQPDQPTGFSVEKAEQAAPAELPVVQQAAIAPVSSKPWSELEVVNSSFIIETLSVEGTDQVMANASPADLRLKPEVDSQFVTDSLTLGAYTSGSGRTPSFF